MEILFKDDEWLYYLDNHKRITYRSIEKYPNIDLSNIKHLKDSKVLYHYRYVKNGEVYPVYYEYNGKFITKHIGQYALFYKTLYYTKDYTSTNLNLI